MHRRRRWTCYSSLLLQPLLHQSQAFRPLCAQRLASPLANPVGIDPRVGHRFIHQQVWADELMTNTRPHAARTSSASRSPSITTGYKFMCDRKQCISCLYTIVRRLLLIRRLLPIRRLASTILLQSHDVEYDHTATIITIQPEALTGVTSSPKQAHDSNVTITVVTDSAKDFTTASAYLYTAVIAIPVHALT